MLKINNKYRYFKKTKEPTQKDFKNEQDYELAKALYDLEKKIGHLVSMNPIRDDVKLKTIKKRLPRIEIKVGATIFIERWDGNGIPDKVKVVGVKVGKTRAVVRTNKGFFVFSIWNSKKDNIPFNWTCKGKEWQKEYMKWVDGNKYFLYAETVELTTRK